MMPGAVQGSGYPAVASNIRLAANVPASSTADRLRTVTPTTAALASTTGVRAGTAVNEERTAPVAYSPVTARTPSTTTTISAALSPLNVPPSGPSSSGFGVRAPTATPKLLVTPAATASTSTAQVHHVDRRLTCLRHSDDTMRGAVMPMVVM